MSLNSIIDNLRIRFKPTWTNSTGTGANESRVKLKNSNSNLISGRDSNIRGDYVAGNKLTRQEIDKHPFIEISLGQRSSNQGEYTIDFHLRNAGDAPCILQNFMLADEEIKISKKPITPTDEPYRIRQNITNYKARQQKLDNPLVKVTYKDLNSRLYATTATIVQGSMVVGTYNIDEVDNNEFHILSGKEK